MSKYVVELIGTFFLVLTFGLTAVLGAAGALAPLAIGAVLMAMVCAGGPVSGAHYNPAVTVAVFIRGRCAGKEIAPYLVAQLLGAAVAALLVLKIFGPAVLDAGQSIERHNVDQVGAGAIVAAELLFTFALVHVFLHVGAAGSAEGRRLAGLAIGATFAAGAFAVGALSLGSFNPAISTALCITGRLGWADAWMHVLPQVLGAVLAAFTFKALHPQDS